METDGKRLGASHSRPCGIWEGEKGTTTYLDNLLTERTYHWQQRFTKQAVSEGIIEWLENVP